MEESTTDEVTINTPLLGNVDTKNSENGTKTAEETIKEHQVYRAKLKIKWFVLFLLLWQFVSSYHCVFAISAVEDSLKNKLGINNVVYSSFVLVTYRKTLVFNH